MELQGLLSPGVAAEEIIRPTSAIHLVGVSALKQPGGFPVPHEYASIMQTLQRTFFIKHRVNFVMFSRLS